MEVIINWYWKTENAERVWQSLKALNQKSKQRIKWGKSEIIYDRQRSGSLTMAIHKGNKVLVKKLRTSEHLRVELFLTGIFIGGLCSLFRADR